jgi:hypothetical protein
MSTPRYRKVTLDLRAARFAVNAGRASWLHLGIARPKQAPEPIETAPVVRTRNPVYRSPVPISDMEWWAAESRR